MAASRLFRWETAAKAALAGAVLGGSLAITGCGQREAEQESPAVDVAPLPDGATQPRFAREARERGDPYWVTLLNQAGGGVIQHAPESILRYPDRTAEIWIQLLHSGPLTEGFEADGYTEQVTFQRERYRYLFDCPRRAFAVTDRRLMGDGETVLREIRYVADGATPEWRPLEEGGPAPFLFGPACEAE